nr:MAG TPA: hypothetical protein [Crassvirales sp.]
MKYLSSPHLVISLPSKYEEISDTSGNKSTQSIATLLPRVKFYGDFSEEEEHELLDWYYKYTGNQINPSEDYSGVSGFKIMDISYIGYYYDDTHMSEYSGKWVIS